MWEGGMRELALQKRLGHASPESTQIYTRVCDDQVLADYTAALQDRRDRQRGGQGGCPPSMPVAHADRATTAPGSGALPVGPASERAPAGVSPVRGAVAPASRTGSTPRCSARLFDTAGPARGHAPARRGVCGDALPDLPVAGPRRRAGLSAADGPAVRSPFTRRCTPAGREWIWTCSTSTAPDWRNSTTPTGPTRAPEVAPRADAAAPR